MAETLSRMTSSSVTARRTRRSFATSRSGCGRTGCDVWFDEWEIRPGDHIPARIEEGLEHSRVLLLCMSANAFGCRLGAAGKRRVPVPRPAEQGSPLHSPPARRGDHQRIAGPVRVHSDGSSEDREREYPSLLEACRPPESRPTAEQEASRADSRRRVLSLGHTDWIHSIAFSAGRSPCGERRGRQYGAVVGRRDGVPAEACLRSLEGHSGDVIAWR